MYKNNNFIQTSVLKVVLLCTLFLHRPKYICITKSAYDSLVRAEYPLSSEKPRHSLSELSRCYNVGVIQHELLLTYEKTPARERNISEIVNKNEPFLEPTIPQDKSLHCYHIWMNRLDTSPAQTQSNLSKLLFCLGLVIRKMGNTSTSLLCY